MEALMLSGLDFYLKDTACTQILRLYLWILHLGVLILDSKLCTISQMKVMCL